MKHSREESKAPRPLQSARRRPWRRKSASTAAASPTRTVRCLARLHHLLFAAAATLALRAAVPARADPGDGNGTLTWCLGEYDLRRVGGPEYPDFLASLQEVIDDAVRASDRWPSYAVGTEGAPEYALAQCRRDVPPDDCSRCLYAHRGSILARDACGAGGVRSGLCLLRYDVQDFGRFDSDEAMAAAHDAARSPPGLTRDVVYSLLNAVAANATAGDGPPRTVAGVADYRDDSSTAGAGSRATVYGLVQCITQLSARNCSRCLTGALLRLSEEFNSSAGMQMLRPSCMLQYNSSVFFNASLMPLIHVSVPDAPSPSNTDATSPSHGRSLTLAIGLPVGTAVALTLTTLLCLIQRSRRTKNVTAGSGNYSYETLVAATDNFSEENKLGSGGCGVVYKGVLEDKQEIAVKKLGSKGKREMETEVSLVAQLQHENLVKFLGHCFQGGEMFLIYEYLNNKSLSNYFKDGRVQSIPLFLQLRNRGVTPCFLRKQKVRKSNAEEVTANNQAIVRITRQSSESRRPQVYELALHTELADSVDYKKLEWPKWFDIIKGVARGLTYLHRDSGKDIVHRDLKPSNVLLDSNFAAKIADFDLARGYSREKGHGSTKKVAGTYGYIAPECFKGSQFSPKSDVYSYGVLVLEIMVGYSVRTFDAQNSMISLVEYVWQHWNDGRVEDILDTDHLGLVGHDQMKQALQCVHVALLCIQNDYNKRPNMEEVLHFLNTEMHLGDPSVPGFTMPAANEGCGRQPQAPSNNGLTISILEPR